jgi:hypothetical protein
VSLSGSTVVLSKWARKLNKKLLAVSVLGQMKIDWVNTKKKSSVTVAVGSTQIMSLKGFMLKKSMTLQGSQ